MEIIISDHAKFEMVRRRLSEENVLNVAKNPEQVVKLEGERVVHQSKIYDENTGKHILLRVICETRHSQLFVITAYSTSKIDKYWAEED
jgi:hypothetical protein